MKHLCSSEASATFVTLGIARAEHGPFFAVSKLRKVASAGGLSAFFARLRLKPGSGSRLCGTAWSLLLLLTARPLPIESSLPLADTNLDSPPEAEDERGDEVDPSKKE